jgi:uncharacterized protein (DUF486 family)
MLTALLLLASNLFMTAAWYGHLRHREMSMWLAIAVSWGIAFFEYCLQVPANRLGYASGLSATQLKTMQEVITLVVFAAFAQLYLHEPLRWNVAVGFTLIAAGAAFVYKPW